jgi:hypothetical protein
MKPVEPTGIIGRPSRGRPGSFPSLPGDARGFSQTRVSSLIVIAPRQLAVTGRKIGQTSRGPPD